MLDAKREMWPVNKDGLNVFHLQERWDSSNLEGRVCAPHLDKFEILGFPVVLR